MPANGDAARRDMWAGRIERCLAADMTVKERYALNKVAESSLCEWMAYFREGAPTVSPQVERGVELDEGHAPRPRAAALRARSPLPIRVNRGRRCVSLDAAVCARVGAGGYCGPARGRAPATSGRFRRKRAPIPPWSWTSVRFSAGVVRCQLRRPGETPAPRGVSGQFGLRNRPEVCRWGSRVARGARRHCAG